MAAAVCGSRAEWSARRAASRRTAGVWRYVSESGLGDIGTAAALRSSHVGRASSGRRGAWLGPCGVAGAAQGRYLFAAAAVLVREHGQGIRRQGSGHCRPLPRSAGEGPGGVRGREAEHSSVGARRTGYVESANGKIVRGFKSTYRRHGTLNLFAALQVATGHVQTATTARQRREEFLRFMDAVAAETPANRELHVILDNYGTHKKCDAWLAQHPNVHFHFTPTSASWLNQVEIWFGIFSRKALRGASFKSVAELRAAIEAFVAAYGPKAKPFKWRKREVKGSQLHNTIVNLRN